MRGRPKATNVVGCPIAATPPGRVRVLALRRPKPLDLTAVGPRAPLVTVVNTTSTGAERAYRGLSPFNVGPIPLYGGRQASCLENAWQFSKLYEEHADAAGEPSAAYWAWAEAGWADPEPRRFPMGRGRKPLCSLWDGAKLDYLTARRVIYAPLYAAAVTRTPAYALLAQDYARACAAGGHLVLTDYDGWDHIGQGIALEAVIDLPHPKMGHAFVLAGCLEGNLFWAPEAAPVPAPAPAPAPAPGPLRDDDVDALLAAWCGEAP